MKHISLFALIAVALAGPALAQANKTRVERSPVASAAGYDGGWTFEATTTVGNCPAMVPNSVTIRDHRVAGAGGSSAPWGYAESDGTIVARFTDQSGRVARANGRLRTADGSGAWSSSTDMCGGTWRAYRGGGDRSAQQ